MNTIKIQIEKWGNFLFLLGTVLMAILLPLHKMSTSLAFILISLGFILGKKERLKWSSSLAFVALSVIMYMGLHGISYFFSFYKTYAINDLIIKAPLLLLPLFFLFKEDLSSQHKKKVWQVFLATSILVSAFIFLRFLFFLITTGHIMSYTDLVNYTIIHPSYLSMYLLFSLWVLWNREDLFVILKGNRSKLFVSSLVFVVVLLLGSRIAILLALLILAYLSITRVKVIYTLVGGLSALLMLILLIWKLPYLNERFTKGINMFHQEAKQVNEYTVDDRIMIWTNVVELIEEKALWGYSNGDYCYHVLKEKHNTSGFGKGYRQKLNAHNQFLESWLALGLFGLLTLMAIYLSSILLALRTKNTLLIGFLFVCFGFSMVESIFQSQGGVMFFGFFLAFFLHEVKHRNS